MRLIGLELLKIIMDASMIKRRVIEHWHSVTASLYQALYADAAMGLC